MRNPNFFKKKYKSYPVINGNFQKNQLTDNKYVKKK